MPVCPVRSQAVSLTTDNFQDPPSLNFQCYSQRGGTTPAAPLRWDLHTGEQPVRYSGGPALRDRQPSYIRVPAPLRGSPTHWAPARTQSQAPIPCRTPQLHLKYIPRDATGTFTFKAPNLQAH